MKNLKPIKLLSAREQVASSLRKAILSQEIKEGEELTLDKIGERLGVSATPVREAFQILARDGLIKLRANKGAIVLGINEKFIRDHFQIRAILEREAVKIICEENKDISSIREAYEAGKDAIDSNDIYGYSDSNQAFHMAIWELSGNDKMKSILSSLWNGLSIGYNVKGLDYAKKSLDEHKNLLLAIEEYDVDKSVKLMDRHIIRSMDDMLTHYKE